MGTVRLTMAQALVRHLAAQWTEDDEGRRERLFAGCWAIFGHGNVAGMGEALYAHREELPTLRAHNEQAMALSAVAYAKAKFRRRMMAVTTSIGPGATNLVTAAALAHVDRLPVLLLPGDIYASRRPDPVLQQVEDFGDGTVSANDCFRPVSRYFDRITRPEQILTALPRALAVLTDPAECGPVTLALCQDVQAEAYDYPAWFFEDQVHRIRRPGADEAELAQAVAALKKAERPLVIAGGGVLYSGAAKALAGFAERHGLPVAETQAGKGSLPWNHPANAGSIGVTGSSAANALAADADVVLAVGNRLQDFTTGSRALFRAPGRTLIQLNAAVFDAGKHGALPLVADARRGLDELSEALGSWTAPKAQSDRTKGLIAEWTASVDRATAASNAPLPSDAQVLGAVNRAAGRGAIVVCASGGLPGELHKLWRTDAPGGYHLEYGYSCMGYEIAGGLGVKLARPDREVYVLVGDGSYMMMNSEIATAVQQGVKLTIVVLDNRGFGCINRLQNATGGASFNNLFRDIDGAQPIDFALHAASMGAASEKVAGIAELEGALLRAKATDQTSVIVVDTDPMVTTEAGGAWWDVAVPEVSDRDQVRRARAGYEEQLAGHPVTGHDA
ncbi:3D-(3,5/4)-trihydroxycyclohexane-1,2-dione acylhydrolase (decyclizing) [Inquilinus ginsengisoli]|uniref:3D-(3,5/4)-trihydroxycyclohexane-1,2-dione acylhydrolase (decyclizing) n=1 Tax=Inquilinus ginsengisoli TaxID=363840 RepID=UPI003D23A82E